MDRRIPISVAALVADILGPRYTHSRIDHFMELAGIEGEILPGLNRESLKRVSLTMRLSISGLAISFT
jgi:hypothetical protein